MTTVQVPDDLAARLAAEAQRRGMGIDELSAELLQAGLDGDNLEAFIGSGRSGLADLSRTHREIKAGIVARRPARDL